MQATNDHMTEGVFGSDFRNQLWILILDSHNQILESDCENSESRLASFVSKFILEFTKEINGCFVMVFLNCSKV